MPGARVERASLIETSSAFQTGASLINERANGLPGELVEEEGIEPSFAGCRPAVLPLNDSPKKLLAKGVLRCARGFNVVAGWRVERHSHGL